MKLAIQATMIPLRSVVSKVQRRLQQQKILIGKTRWRCPQTPTEDLKIFLQIAIQKLQDAWRSITQNLMTYDRRPMKKVDVPYISWSVLTLNKQIRSTCRVSLTSTALSSPHLTSIHNDPVYTWPLPLVKVPF